MSLTLNVTIVEKCKKNSNLLVLQSDEILNLCLCSIKKPNSRGIVDTFVTKTLEIIHVPLSINIRIHLSLIISLFDLFKDIQILIIVSNNTITIIHHSCILEVTHYDLNIVQLDKP